MHFIQLNAAAALIQINVYLMYEFRSGINRMQWQPHKIPRANEFMTLQFAHRILTSSNLEFL